MSVDERALVELVKKLDEVLGQGPTDTLMTLLLPERWGRATIERSPAAVPNGAPTASIL